MNYRHGDLELVGIKELPKGLTLSKEKVLLVGSGGNPHSFDKGEFYSKRVDNFIFGYFVAKDTTLFHIEHGEIIKAKKLREAKIEDGIYELRNQNEDTHEGMRAVID